VKDQTVELCLIALKQDDHSLGYVRDEHLDAVNAALNIELREILMTLPKRF
jgi:hypothetical protein